VSGPIEQAQSVKADMSARAEAIAANRDLTVQARQRQIDQIWSEGHERIQALQAEHQEAAEREQRSAMESLYRPPSTSPERRASYRQALDRATGVADSPAALADMLELAELSGDEDQAHAAFVIAARRGIDQVVRAYLADRPEQAATYRATGRPTRGRLTREWFETGMAFGLPSKPTLR